MESGVTKIILVFYRKIIFLGDTFQGLLISLYNVYIPMCVRFQYALMRLCSRIDEFLMLWRLLFILLPFPIRFGKVNLKTGRQASRYNHTALPCLTSHPEVINFETRNQSYLTLYIYNARPFINSNPLVFYEEKSRYWLTSVRS